MNHLKLGGSLYISLSCELNVSYITCWVSFLFNVVIVTSRVIKLEICTNQLSINATCQFVSNLCPAVQGKGGEYTDEVERRFRQGATTKTGN